MTDSNPKTKGSNSTPNNQDEQTQQNNTTNSFKKDYVNYGLAELRLDALKTAFQNQKNGEEEIPGPALAGIIDTPVAEKEKVNEKVKKSEPKDNKIPNLESDGWTSNMPDKTF